MTGAARWLAIEVVDSGLLALANGGTALESPGFALREPLEIHFGSAAKAAARRYPRRIENEFWDRMDGVALGKPHAQAKTQADLIHGHLLALLAEVAFEPDAVLLAMPGHFDREQLALLLGIFEFLGLPVVGWVDAAVAAAAANFSAPVEPIRATHLELGLHRAVVTHLAIDPTKCCSTHVETSALVGSVLLESVLAKHIASLFLQQTRFDPLHDAPSEQRLYDALVAGLATLRDADEAEIELESGSTHHRITVSREGLAAVTRPIFESLLSQAAAFEGTKAAGAPAEGPSVLLCSHRFRGFPGLDEALSAVIKQGVYSEARFLPEAAAARACLARPQLIQAREPGQSVPLDWLMTLPLASVEPRLEAKSGA